MSFDTEFDFWPDERLSTLVLALSETQGLDDSPTADPRDTLPLEEDITYWVRVAEQCNLLSVADLDELPDGRVDQMEQIAQELASAVHSELNGRDLITIKENLYLGDLSGPESRLTMLWLGVKGVVTVASHAIERLWMADGVAYHTAIIDASAESIGSCLPAACAFLERPTPAFICCASGQGLSLLVAAAHLSTMSERGRGLAFSETPNELLRGLAARRDVFMPFPFIEVQALSTFCASRLPQKTAPPVHGVSRLRLANFEEPPPLLAAEPGSPVVTPRDTTAWGALALSGGESDAEAEFAPSTPLAKPGVANRISAIDLVKVASSGRKRSRNDGEEEEELLRTPQAKKPQPRASEDAGFKQKFHAEVIGGSGPTAWKFV